MRGRDRCSHRGNRRRSAEATRRGQADGGSVVDPVWCPAVTGHSLQDELRFIRAELDRLVDRRRMQWRSFDNQRYAMLARREAELLDLLRPANEPRQ
jgi:hypothetical protein